MYCGSKLIIWKGNSLDTKTAILANTIYLIYIAFYQNYLLIEYSKNTQKRGKNDENNNFATVTVIETAPSHPQPNRHI